MLGLLFLHLYSPMERQSGDDYIRQLAQFIRENEKGLAEGGLVRRNATQVIPSSFLGWLYPTPCPKPVTLSLDIQHLFYVLVRLEALDIQVGCLDIRVDSPSRPITYGNIIYPPARDSDVFSLASIRSSLSAISRVSLARSWWSVQDIPSIDSELKYIFSSFTKLPSLTICGPGRKVINELIDDYPYQNAAPLDSFKNLQKLECEDIDPRTLFGWDRLSMSLRSLKIKNSGMQNISDIMMGAASLDRVRRTHLAAQHDIATYSSSILDEAEEERPLSQPPIQSLTPSNWAFLRHLFLPDNSLTSFPSELLPYLTELTHLDLSSNLLISIPSGFAELYNLLSLNLSNNIIESVLGVYLNLGQIISLNLSRNRLNSLCGLERLLALERVDLRHNLLEESSEIGRLAILPNLVELWIEGNPFTEVEEGYRNNCFDYFWNEGKTISLDGTRQNRSPDQKSDSTGNLQAAVQTSPPASIIEIDRPRMGAVLSSHKRLDSSHPKSMDPKMTSSIDGNQEHRRRKIARSRVVDLHGDRAAKPASFMLHPPQSFLQDNLNAHKDRKSEILSRVEVARHGTLNSALAYPKKFRHTRHQTDYMPSSHSISHTANHKLPISSGSSRHDSLKEASAADLSKSQQRQHRVSASVSEVYSPSSGDGATESGDHDTYRQRIESLKQDMGESWLKVYSQNERS